MNYFKVVFIAISLCFNLCFVDAQNQKEIKPLTLTGKLSGEKFFMLLDASWDTWSRQITPYLNGTIDDKGNAYFESDSIIEGYYLVNSKIMLYLRPGMNVGIKKIDGHIQSTSHAYMNPLNGLYNQNILKDFVRTHSKLKFDNYCAKVDEKYAPYKTRIENIADGRLREIETYHVEMAETMLKLQYGLANKDFISTDAYTNLLKKVEFSQDFYSILPQWRNWLKDYFKIIKFEYNLSDEKVNSLAFQLKKIKSREVKEVWAWERVVTNATFDDQSYANFKLARKYIKDEHKLKFIENQMTAMELALKGTPFCDLKFKDENGDVISFDKFKGKYVYIDFLGVYCPACIAQLPHLKEIKKTFKGKDIVFVSVCLGDDTAKWKKLIEKHQIDCENLISNNNGISGLYNITYIPHYMLLDKKGRLVTANAPKPHDKELKTMLDKLL
ncbi:MAG: TlpA family protein disulfide reductase [Carboxylicivirga sp.]|nr:TlpA family protein disulfide reductase [Carboxylicivirga sp.]